MTVRQTLWGRTLYWREYCDRPAFLSGKGFVVRRSCLGISRALAAFINILFSTYNP